MLVNDNNLRKSVLKLALPVVLENILMMVVGVVSTIMVGKLGTEALSAVGLVTQTIGFILVISVALSTGSTVLIARLIGQGKQEDAKDAMRQSVIIGAVLFIIVSIICYIFAEPIIHLLFVEADAGVKSFVIQYFKISMFGLPFMLINSIISGNMRGSGNTKTPMYIAALVNLLNFVLSFLLIFGFPLLHIPSYGVSGAAWAVSISRAAGGILSILAIRFMKTDLKTNLIKEYKLNLSLLGRIGKIGLPAMMEQVIMQGGFLMVQVVMSGIGTTALAVMNIGNSINSIAYIPVLGFAVAATTLIGQSLGEGRPETAEKSGWESCKLSVYVSIVMSTILFILAPQLVSIYTDDPEVIKLGIIAIRIFSFIQPFLTYAVVLSGALRGAGDIRYVMLTSFVGIWGQRLFMTIIINNLFRLGALSVWIAWGIDYFVRSIMYLIRFKKGKWKNIKV